MTKKQTKQVKPVIDGTKPGYEKDIATSGQQFFAEGNELPDPQAVVNKSVAAIPSPNLNGALLVVETPVMLVGGVRVKYRKVPAFFFNTARTKMGQILRMSEPQPQEFIADSEGNRIKGDTNPAYLEAKALWETEIRELDELVSSSVSLFSGLILVDPMPPDDAWLPFIAEMFELTGMKVEDSFKSFLYDEARMKELLFKQYVVLSNASDMQNFTDFQSSGDVSIFEVDEATATDMFRA